MAKAKSALERKMELLEAENAKLQRELEARHGYGSNCVGRGNVLFGDPDGDSEAGTFVVDCLGDLRTKVENDSYQLVAPGYCGITHATLDARQIEVRYAITPDHAAYGAEFESQTVSVRFLRGDTDMPDWLSRFIPILTARIGGAGTLPHYKAILSPL